MRPLAPGQAIRPDLGKHSLSSTEKPAILILLSDLSECACVRRVHEKAQIQVEAKAGSSRGTKSESAPNRLAEWV